jgi:hypothetical protein
MKLIKLIAVTIFFGGLSTPIESGRATGSRAIWGWVH